MSTHHDNVIFILHIRVYDRNGSSAIGDSHPDTQACSPDPDDRPIMDQFETGVYRYAKTCLQNLEHIMHEGVARTLS